MAFFNFIQPYNETAIVCEALRGLRDIAECHEREITERYSIRKKYELAAKIIEANTDVLKTAIGSTQAERSRMMDCLEKIFQMPSVDEKALKLAEMAFDYLKSTSAVAAINAAPKMPMLL